MLANENECYFMGIHVLEGCSDAIFCRGLSTSTPGPIMSLRRNQIGWVLRATWAKETQAAIAAAKGSYRAS